MHTGSACNELGIFFLEWCVHNLNFDASSDALETVRVVLTGRCSSAVDGGSSGGSSNVNKRNNNNKSRSARMFSVTPPSWVHLHPRSIRSKLPHLQRWHRRSSLLRGRKWRLLSLCWICIWWHIHHRELFWCLLSRKGQHILWLFERRQFIYPTSVPPMIFSTSDMSSIQRREHWFLMLNRTHHFCISIMTELTKYQDRKWGDSKAQLAYDLKLQYCQQGQVAMGILWYLFWTLSKRINTEWVTKFIIRVLIQFVTLSMKFVLAKYN